MNDTNDTDAIEKAFAMFQAADFHPDVVSTPYGEITKDGGPPEAIAWLQGLMTPKLLNVSKNNLDSLFLNPEAEASWDACVAAMVQEGVRRGHFIPDPRVATSADFHKLAAEGNPRIVSVALLEPSFPDLTIRLFAVVPWRWRFVPLACRRWTRELQASVAWNKTIASDVVVKVHPAPVPWPWRKR